MASITDLDREDRLRLMRFVCAFAWADLEVQDDEKVVVERLIKTLDLEADREQIMRWLKSPPPPEDVDPTRVPRAHRQLFLDAARAVFSADGVIDPKEQENFELLEQLMI
ncbi:tellurite resistance TerB family protein [Paraliomyxa miuraensis]|uniref:tellurite resistance TerB family protein n=1 Tax=Paraliomyxa miuraensis TaxID=376150 RepID=UPI002255F38E|nr:TerB family tellurite resistance protein [Paraliomyxa miuraensis]MCX4242006.1 TerB family tellurite resistance protein [Paraliomyxa miuraensis]